MSHGKIYIGQVRQGALTGSVAVRIDRQSVLGNPFVMEGEGKRDYVCALYEKWFHKQLNDGTGTQNAIFPELQRIHDIVANGQDVTLLCWCAPKRCHGETIRNLLISELSK